MATSTVVCLLALLALTFSPALVKADGYSSGRATFYGNEPWYWSIHHGSCGKGYIWPDQGTGWDIAALSDAHPDYAGSCGRCYEVKCENQGFKDGYGNWIDRKGMCKDQDAAVVVTVTDTCPCVYGNNYYSNKRWCCGDMNHFDISVWAFQKLTDMKWGVIPIKYRAVDCGHQPSKKAYGDSFPGEFPAKSDANKRSSDFYYKYFPNGGYLNSKRGDGSSQVDVNTYLNMAGMGGGGQAASGKK